MYELNNESILNIIKFSNAILTLSKDENNLSFPFSIFYQDNFQLPFKNYLESSFSYLNNEKIIDENQLVKTEYEIDKDSKNNQLIKIILNNYRNKLDLLKKINEKKEESENKKKKDDEKKEKKNKDMNFKKEKTRNRTKTPIQNSKEIFNNKVKNTKEDNKIKNINKFNKVIINKKENNITKIDANKLKNKRENELYRKKKDINKSINRSKEKNNNNISTNEMNLTDVVRSRTPEIEKKKKKKKKDDYIYYHVDFSELYRKNGEEKLKTYLKDK